MFFLFDWILRLFEFFFSLLHRYVLWYFEEHHSIGVFPDRKPPGQLYAKNYFQSDRTGIWIHFREWLTSTSSSSSSSKKQQQKQQQSSSKPKAAVLFISHGLGEHIARYENTVDRLKKLYNKEEDGEEEDNSQQEAFDCLSVFLHEHQGHGASEGERRYVERFSDYAEDFEKFVKTRMEAHPELADLPRFALCHSMGGLIGAFLATRVNPDLFNNGGGIIFSGPALKPDPKVASPTTIAIGKFFSNFIPKLPVATLDPTFVCRDKQTMDLYVRDAIVGNAPLRARWAAGMIEAMEIVKKNADRIKCGVLFVHGGDDRICSVEGTKEFYELVVNAKHKQLNVYNGSYHEVFADPEHGQRALRDVVAFMKKCIASSASSS